MSLFSVGGGIGFALAPTLTTALAVAWGTTGVLAYLVPTVAITILLARFAGGAASPASHPSGRPLGTERDDWRAFAILGGVTICRSIVFFGLNTFLALYFMSRWGQTAAAGNRAPAVFLGTSIAGTLLGGWLADRFGRRAVLRAGFGSASVLLALFVLTPDRTWALALLVPMAVCFFLPTSVQVVLGQEYLPNRVGVASGVTLGLSVSVGGMVTPILGRLADRRGVGAVFLALLGVQLLLSALTIALPSAVGRGRHLRPVDQSRPRESEGRGLIQGAGDPA
jgi:FSR family fosmidomycin resistance protein-like MFS transporter